MTIREKRSKTNLLINPRFQYSFIKQFFVLLIAIFAVILLAGNWVLSPLLDLIGGLELPPEHEIWAVVDNFKTYAIYMATLLFLVLSCLFVMASLIISHRIAGPLKNLQNAIARMAAAKKLTKVYFREKDYFRDLEQDFNEMVDKFE